MASGQARGRLLYVFRAYDLPKILEEYGSDLSERILRNTIMWHCIVDKVLETLLDQEILHRSTKRRCYRVLTDVEENAVRDILLEWYSVNTVRAQVNSGLAVLMD